jgi:hypothetical protein
VGVTWVAVGDGEHGYAGGFACLVPRGEHDDGRTVFAASFLTGQMLVAPQVAK